MTASTTNPLGVKGVGEAGTIASTPAVINAVIDALKPYGVTDMRMPAPSVWRAIQEANASGRSAGLAHRHHHPDRPGRTGGVGMSQGGELRRRARAAPPQGGPRRSRPAIEVAPMPPEGEAWSPQSRAARRLRCAHDPAAFDYVRPASVAEAVAALGEHGDEAKLLAGGHSLLPLMKLRLASPGVIVDLGRIPDLRGVRDDGDALAIGAMTTHHAVVADPLVREHVPLLAHTTAMVGDQQARNRGTIGGALAHGDAAGDLPAVAQALEAEMVWRARRGPARSPRRSSSSTT